MKNLSFLAFSLLLTIVFTSSTVVPPVVCIIPRYADCIDPNEDINDKEFNCFNDKIAQHINENFKYSSLAFPANIGDEAVLLVNIDKNGRVVGSDFSEIMVEVNITTGEIVEVEIPKGINPIIDEELIRVFNSLPEFIPGTCDGQPEDWTLEFMITFTMNGIEHRIVLY